jgi:hypothetical protein
MMNKPWKSGLTALVLGTMIIQGGVPVFAADTTTPVVTTPANYGLTQDVRVAIKSMAVATTTKGVQISATVRLYNGSSSSYRIPEHELRVRTSEGLVYTLKPSVSNKATLQPKEIGELVYMSVVDSKAQIQIDQLSFVKVDLYSYPKIETNLLSIPVGSEVWYETGSEPGQQLNPLAWGTNFSIPGVNSGIVYTPVDFTEQSTTEGKIKVVTVLAENPGTGRELIPDFRIDAMSVQKTYAGVRADKDSAALEPGEKKYIHFAIPIESGVTISNLLVTTTDAFTASAGEQQTVIATGKLSMALPSGKQIGGASYKIGTPIVFDPLSKFIPQDISASLMSLELFENKGEGFKTVVAKLKVTNNGTTTNLLKVPAADLISEGGYSFSGTSSSGESSSSSAAAAGSLTTQVLPGTSSVVSYSFLLPLSENSEHFSLKLSDDQTAAPYKSKIAQLSLPLQKDDVGKAVNTVIHLYPYDIKLIDWNISATGAGQNFSYKIKTNFDIENPEQIVADPSFTKLQFELINDSDAVVGIKTVNLTGSDRLFSGDQTLVMDGNTSQIDLPLTMNIYEIIATPNGDARRLLFTNHY